MNNLKCDRYLLQLGQRTLVMGILNLTPDSFSGDGMYKVKKSGFGIQSIVNRADRMVEEGADIIDVGGESTRPGANPVSVKEEVSRVIPVIKRLVKKLKVPISLDTYKSEVAERGLDLGASMVNCINGLRGDTRLAEVVARYDVPVVIMHIKGNPMTMQRNPAYRLLITEIIDYFKDSIRIATRAGIKEEKIVLDPGIGFGKTINHNIEILRRLNEFRCLNKPILIGTSRKSLIGSILGLQVEERLFGTSATVAVSICNGADIVRIHDVKEMVQVVRMTDAIVRNNAGRRDSIA